jgi:hypothetical protein
VASFELRQAEAKEEADSLREWKLEKQEQQRKDAKFLGIARNGECFWALLMTLGQ